MIRGRGVVLSRGSGDGELHDLTSAKVSLPQQALSLPG